MKGAPKSIWRFRIKPPFLLVCLPAIVFVDKSMLPAFSFLLQVFTFLFKSMAEDSPSHRLHATTSDFTGFFQGASHSLSQTQREPSVNLEVLSTDTEASLRKRVTRIQLFGSSRKKSNQSPMSSAVVSPHDSSELLVWADSSDRWVSQFFYSSPSLWQYNFILLTQGSILDSHLLHLHLFPWSHSQNPLVLSLPLPSVTLDYWNLLNHWQCPRIPQCSQPLHLDLLPINLILLVAVGLVQWPPGLHSLSKQFLCHLMICQNTKTFLHDHRLRTPTSTPPPTPHLPKINSPIYLRGQTPTLIIVAAHWQAASDGDDGSLCRTSWYSRKNSDSDKDQETPGPSCTQESPRVTADEKKGLPPSLQQHPSPITRSVQTSKNFNSPSIQSHTKLMSNSIRTRPFSIPLPQTPVPSLPPPEILLSTLGQTSKTELGP